MLHEFIILVGIIYLARITKTEKPVRYIIYRIHSIPNQTFQNGGFVISSGDCNQLNIKNLQLGNGYENHPYIITTLLQMCNKSLQKLIIEGITLEILEEISQHCPNITHLSLCAYQDVSKSLPKLISSLHHLKVLTLGHH